MRRQNSLAIRQPSNEGKVLSKFKKSKNRGDKPEPQYLKTQQLENRHKAESLLQLEIIADRIIKKINVISSVVLKMLSKEDKKIYNRLIEAIVGEQKFKIELANAEKMRDHAKVDDLTKLIERTCKVQLEIAENYIPKENLLAQINSTKNITKEYSPRYENLSYGMFDKRNTDDNRQKQNKRNHTETNQNSNSLFKLFEHMEDLSQKVNVKVDDCKTWNSLLKKTSSEIEDLKKTNREIQKLNRRLMEQDLEIHNLQKQSNYIDSLTKDLNTANEEKSFMDKKYKQLEEEFEVLVREKLHVEAELTKKGRQIKSMEQRYKTKLYNYRQELEILRSDISSQRSIDQVISFKMSEDLEVFRVELMAMVQAIKQQYESAIDEVKENTRQLRNSLANKEMQGLDYQLQIESLQVENSQVKNQLKKEKERNLNIIAQYEKQKQKKSDRNKFLSISSQTKLIFRPQPSRSKSLKLHLIDDIQVFPRKIETVSHEMQTDPKFHRLQTLRVVDSINDQLIKNRNLKISPQLEEFFLQITQKTDKDTETVDSKKQLGDQFSQTQSEAKIEVQIQVENNLKNSITQTDSTESKMTNEVGQQIEKLDLKIVQCINSKYPSSITKKNIEIQTNLPLLAIYSNINQFQYSPTSVERHLQSISRKQNDKNFDQYNPRSPPYCQTIQYCHSSHAKSQPTVRQPNEILALLLQAQQCLIVPQITVLRQQMHLLRKQISCLRSRGSREQKQRQEENVFQFCL